MELGEGGKDEVFLLWMDGGRIGLGSGLGSGLGLGKGVDGMG